MRQFKCGGCKRQSGYSKHKQKLEYFAEMKDMTNETRTYECEHCGTENRVTNPSVVWMLIDKGN